MPRCCGATAKQNVTIPIILFFNGLRLAQPGRDLDYKKLPAAWRELPADFVSCLRPAAGVEAK